MKTAAVILAAALPFACGGCGHGKGEAVEEGGGWGLKVTFAYGKASVGAEYTPRYYRRPKLPQGDGSAKSPVLVDPVK